MSSHADSLYRRVIQADEATHLSTLQSVAKSLGGDTSDVDSCSFDFSAVMVDVGTFLQTARVLEFVGIDACVNPRSFPLPPPPALAALRCAVLR